MQYPIAFLLMITSLIACAQPQTEPSHLVPPKTYWQSFGFQKQPKQIGIGYYKSDSQFLQDKTGQYMLVGFSVFFFGIIAYMISTSVIDLRRGFKHRITGKITDKKMDVRTSTTHSPNGKTGSSSSHSSTSRHYYVYIDDVQYPIDQQHYGKLKVGKAIVLEQAPKSHLTLLLEVTENRTH